MVLVPSNGGNGLTQADQPEPGAYFGAGEPRRIFIHAPQYHWHQYSLQGVDYDARWAIEGIDQTLYEFGHQTEQRLG